MPRLRAAVDEELADIGAMRLVGRPRGMQRDSADDARLVARDENDRARVGALERGAPPLARRIDGKRLHEADAGAAVNGVGQDHRQLVDIRGRGRSRDDVDGQRHAARSRPFSRSAPFMHAYSP